MRVTCMKCQDCIFFERRTLEEKTNVCKELGNLPEDEVCNEFLFNYKNIDLTDSNIKRLLKIIRSINTKDLRTLCMLANQEITTRKNGYLMGSLYYIKPIPSLDYYVKVVLLDANDKYAHVQGIMNGKKWDGEMLLSSLIPLDSMPKDFKSDDSIINKYYKEEQNKQTYKLSFKRNKKIKDKTEELDEQATEFLNEKDSESSYELEDKEEVIEYKEEEKVKECNFDGTFDENDLDENYNVDLEE